MSNNIPEGFDVGVTDLIEIRVPNDLRSAKEPEEKILTELERSGYSADTVFAVKLALEEAMTNAVKHGNRNDPGKAIVVRYFVGERHTVVMVRDQGSGFCPSAVPDPTESENLERPNGRGIMLMQSYMSKVWYNPCGNEVWMMKKREEGLP